MSNKAYCDGGYGVTGNISKYYYLQQLSDENKKKYLHRLKEEDEQKYEEFLEFIKLSEGI